MSKSVREGRVNNKVSNKVSITKKQFEDTLVKVFVQPVSDKPLEGDQSKKRTSGSHRADGYSGRRKSQGKTEGKED